MPIRTLVRVNNCFSFCYRKLLISTQRKPHLIPWINKNETAENGMAYQKKKYCTNQMPESFAHRKNLRTKENDQRNKFVDVTKELLFFCWLFRTLNRPYFFGWKWFICLFLQTYTSAYVPLSRLVLFRWQLWLLPIWIPLTFEFRNDSYKIRVLFKRQL